MPTTSTPTRGEVFVLPASSSPYTNAIDLPVYVTFAKRSATPVQGGACGDGDDGWYIEYRTEAEGPMVDENTPGLHRIYVSDKQAARNAKYTETVRLLEEDRS
jgi:hypothetical protein